MRANSCGALLSKAFRSSSAAICFGLRSRYVAPPSSSSLMARKISPLARMPLAVPLAQAQKGRAAVSVQSLFVWNLSA